MSRTIGGWTRILAARYANQKQAAEQAAFDADLDYLNSLGAFMVQVGGHQLPWPPNTTLHDRLVAELSCAARKAVTTPWPTFQDLWDAA